MGRWLRPPGHQGGIGRAIAVRLGRDGAAVAELRHQLRIGPAAKYETMTHKRIQMPVTTEITESTERSPPRSETGVHSDPKSFDPLGQLPVNGPVELIVGDHLVLLRPLLSVVSVSSVVP